MFGIRTQFVRPPEKWWQKGVVSFIISQPRVTQAIRLLSFVFISRFYHQFDSIWPFPFFSLLDGSRHILSHINCIFRTEGNSTHNVCVWCSKSMTTLTSRQSLDTCMKRIYKYKNDGWKKKKKKTPYLSMCFLHMKTQKGRKIMYHINCRMCVLDIR